MESKTVYDMYLKEVAKHKPLPVDKQKSLCKQAQEGNSNAREKLILTTQRYVISQAVKYCRDRETLPELISECTVGLNKAIDSFDPSKGAVFLTYANTWIFQSIQNYFQTHQKTVRQPVNRRKESYSVFSMDHNTFTEEETHSYDKYLGPDRSISIEQDIDDGTYLKELSERMKLLDEREASIIRMYFGINEEEELSFQNIGKELDLTGERIRNLYKGAIHKLQQG